MKKILNIIFLCLLINSCSSVRVVETPSNDKNLTELNNNISNKEIIIETLNQQNYNAVDGELKHDSIIFKTTKKIYHAMRLSDIKKVIFVKSGDNNNAQIELNSGLIINAVNINQNQDSIRFFSEKFLRKSLPLSELKSICHDNNFLGGLEGSFFGTTTGAIFGALLFQAKVGESYDGSPRYDKFTSAVYGGLIGLILGGIIGAVIGHSYIYIF